MNLLYVSFEKSLYILNGFESRVPIKQTFVMFHKATMVQVSAQTVCRRSFFESTFEGFTVARQKSTFRGTAGDAKNSLCGSRYDPFTGSLLKMCWLATSLTLRRSPAHFQNSPVNGP